MKVSDCISLIESAVVKFGVKVDIEKDVFFCTRVFFKGSVLSKNEIEFVSYLNYRLDLILSVDFNHKFYVHINHDEL